MTFGDATPLTAAASRSSKESPHISLNDSLKNRTDTQVRSSFEDRLRSKISGNATTPLAAAAHLSLNDSLKNWTDTQVRSNFAQSKISGNATTPLTAAAASLSSEESHHVSRNHSLENRADFGSQNTQARSRFEDRLQSKKTSNATNTPSRPPKEDG